MEVLSVEAKSYVVFCAFQVNTNNSTAVLLHWSSPNIHQLPKLFREVHNEVISALPTSAVKSGAEVVPNVITLHMESGKNSTVPLLLTAVFSFINQEILESCMNHKGT